MKEHHDENDDLLLSVLGETTLLEATDRQLLAVVAMRFHSSIFVGAREVRRHGYDGPADTPIFKCSGSKLVLPQLLRMALAYVESRVRLDDNSSIDE